MIDKSYYDEDTLFKVYEVLHAYGFEAGEATDLVNQLQNKGILFRERTPEGEE